MRYRAAIALICLAVLLIALGGCAKPPPPPVAAAPPPVVPGWPTLTPDEVVGAYCIDEGDYHLQRAMVQAPVGFGHKEELAIAVGYTRAALVVIPADQPEDILGAPAAPVAPAAAAAPAKPAA